MLLYFKISQRMRRHYKFWLTPIVASPAFIIPRPTVLVFIPLPVNRFPTKLASNVPNSMQRNSPLSYFAIFSIVTFYQLQDYSRDLTLSMTPLISLSKIISVVMHDPYLFYTAASVAEVATVTCVVT